LPDKQNCWEFMKCGREPGGSNVDELGICPTAIDQSCNGINCGKNAGRICWTISGTFCSGKIQGSFAKKWYDCLNCEFFKQTKQEEGLNLIVWPREQNISAKTVHSNHQFFLPESTKNILIKNVQLISNNILDERIPDPSILKNIENTFHDGFDNIDLNSCITYLKISDASIYSHMVNVAIFSTFIGKILDLNSIIIKELALGALLHDIGKMKIPRYILDNTDNLSLNEIEIMKQHTIYGHQIIEKMNLSTKIAEVALNHHEQQDGKGYPRGLEGDEIPLYAQIVAIANTYDALTSKNTQDQKPDYHEAVNIMLFEKQNAFNFGILYKFLSVVYKQNTDSLKNTFKSIITA